MSLSAGVTALHLWVGLAFGMGSGDLNSGPHSLCSVCFTDGLSHLPSPRCLWYWLCFYVKLLWENLKASVGMMGHAQQHNTVLRDLQFYSTAKTVSWSVILTTQVSEDEVLAGFDFSDYRSLTFREWILFCKHLYRKVLYNISNISLLCQFNVLSPI